MLHPPDLSINLSKIPYLNIIPLTLKTYNYCCLTPIALAPFATGLPMAPPEVEAIPFPTAPLSLLDSSHHTLK